MGQGKVNIAKYLASHTIYCAVLRVVMRRYDEIIAKLTPFLKQTGFNPKTDVHFMPVSGYTGANIKDRSSACSWYNGPSLLEYLDDLKTLDRKLNAPLMIPVAEKYKVSILFARPLLLSHTIFHRIWVRLLLAKSNQVTSRRTNLSFSCQTR